MAGRTEIEWTDHTWNPIRGCWPVSAGCANCYAAAHAARFAGRKQPFEGLARFDANGPRWTGKLMVVDRDLFWPLRKRPRLCFVNSVSDLFWEKVPGAVRARIVAVMRAARSSTFQVLTKRPIVMHAWWTSDEFRRLEEQAWSEIAERAVVEFGIPEEDVPERLPDVWPPPNIWLGVSAEDQHAFNARASWLMQCESPVRFLSAEPLLGRIDIREWVGREDGANLGWVIAGGESTRRARPVHPAWIADLRDACRASNVPFFFKQWGTWAPTFGEGDEYAGTPESTVVTDPVFGPARVARTGAKMPAMIDGRQWMEIPTL